MNDTDKSRSVDLERLMSANVTEISLLCLQACMHTNTQADEELCLPDGPGLQRFYKNLQFETKIILMKLCCIGGNIKMLKEEIHV